MNGSLCVVYSSLGLGGIPTKIVDIVNQMTVSHPKTRIRILLKKRQAFSLQSSITNPNVMVTIFPDRYPQWSVLYVFWVWFFILSYKPGAILSFISPYAIPVLVTKILFFWRKTRIVVSEDHFTSEMIRNMAHPSVQYWGVRLLYPLADAIIVPTRAVKRDLRHSFGIHPSKTHVVANWSRYVQLPIIRGGRIYDCIYIGRFEKTKNILPVLSILSAIIRKPAPDLSCLFVGAGSQAGAYEKYIQQHKLTKNIRVLPPTTDVAGFLRQSKILIFNPKINTEGFPVAVLDAMACGAIVITKYFYGVTEVLNRSNGYIVRSDKEMAGRIKEVLETYPTQGTVIKLAKKHVAAYNSLANIRSYTQLFHGKIS